MVPAVDPIRLHAFLAESLALWRVDAAVEAAEAPIVAVIRDRTGTIVWIERPAAHDLPFRWLVRWRSALDSPGSSREQRPKGCGSLVGLLNAVRSALGVDRGAAVRVAPAPADR
jgi:hypothetical protein